MGTRKVSQYIKKGWSIREKSEAKKVAEIELNQRHFTFGVKAPNRIRLQMESQAISEAKAQAKIFSY